MGNYLLGLRYIWNYFIKTKSWLKSFQSAINYIVVNPFFIGDDIFVKSLTYTQVYTVTELK